MAQLSRHGFTDRRGRAGQFKRSVVGVLFVFEVEHIIWK